MARKAKSENIADNRTKLIDTLSFASFVTKDDDDKYSYVKVSNGFLTASDGNITMGGPIDVDLNLCLQGAQFKAALEQCGQQFQLTQLDAGVSIKSEKFRALIPSVQSDTIAPYSADPPCGSMTDAIKTAFEIVLPLINNKGDRAINQCALLRNETIIGTNGHVMIEHWHGVNLPPNLKIPMKTMQAVKNIKKALVAFGFSTNTITFYFDDGCFIKSNMIALDYPTQVDDILNKAFRHNLQPRPEELYKGLKAIEKFVNDDVIFFHDSYVATSQSLAIGANYRVEGLPGNRKYGSGYLKFIEDFSHNIAYPDDKTEPTPFASKITRGVIMGRA